MTTLTIEEFGTQLVKTGDLDPVYIAMTGAELDPATLDRLCLAYWCFYSLATAAKIAENDGERYWLMMMEAAVNDGYPKPWPRGAERRHFRGAQATGAVAELMEKHPNASHAVSKMTLSGYSRPTFKEVSKAARQNRGFGDWMAFKIADMAERVLNVPVDFSDCELGIYKDPRQGAALAWLEMQDKWVHPEHRENRETPWLYPIKDSELKDCVAHYIKVFRKKRLAVSTSFGVRPVNVQEIETIFCKYKSYRKGHYPPGKDIREIRHGLEAMRSDLGDQLLKAMP